MPSSDSYIVLVEKIGMLDYFMLELYASGQNEMTTKWRVQYSTKVKTSRKYRKMTD